MNANIVCFASAKGGSGKTVLTASIASFLNGIGKKCLIIDCDAATHGMSLLYLSEVASNKSKSKKGLFEISSKEKINLFENSIIHIENSVDFLPATYNFTLGFDPEEFFEDNSLLNIINELRDKYDYIFLDAQAGSDKYSQLAMRDDISDKVVIVSEYDPLSSAGIERLKQVIGKDLDYTRTWILLNKMLPEFIDKFSEFLSVAKYLPPIPWNADIVRAYAKRKLALDLQNGNVFTLAIMRIVRELFGDEVEKDIDKWKEEKTFALREPLKKQYNQIEKELQGFFELRNHISYEKNRRVFRRELFIKLGIISIFISFLVFISFFREYTVIKTLDWKSLIPMILFMFMIMYQLPLLKVTSNKAIEELEDKKLDIKIKVLEEKLQQLEAMRSADLESIVSKKS